MPFACPQLGADFHLKNILRCWTRLSPAPAIHYAWHSWVPPHILSSSAAHAFVPLTPRTALGALDNLKAKLKAAFKKRSEKKSAQDKPAQDKPADIQAPQKPAEDAKPAEAAAATGTRPLLTSQLRPSLKNLPPPVRTSQHHSPKTRI